MLLSRPENFACILHKTHIKPLTKLKKNVSMMNDVKLYKIVIVMVATTDFVTLEMK